MSALVEAILSGHTETARRLATSHPELLDQPSYTGRLPLQLAWAAGHAEMAVALLRAGAPGRETLPSVSDLLVAYLEWISEHIFFAGWLDDLEFVVWDAITTDAAPSGDPEDPINAIRHSPALRADLRFLADEAGGWVMYGERAPHFVDLSAWLSRFDDWQRRRHPGGRQ